MGSHVCAWMQGIFTKRPGALPSLSLLGAVIDEAHAEPSMPSDLPTVPHSKAAAQGSPAPPQAAARPGSGQQEPAPAAGAAQLADDVQQGACSSLGSSAAHPAAPLGPPQQGEDAEPSPAAMQQAAETLEREGCAGDSLGAEPSERPAEAAGASINKRPVAGPAMPSAELLAAAAEAREAVRRALLLAGVPRVSHWDTLSLPALSHLAPKTGLHSRSSGAVRPAAGWFPPH